MTNDTGTRTRHLRHVARDTPGAMPRRVRTASRVVGRWHVSPDPWRHPVAVAPVTRHADTTRLEGTPTVTATISSPDLRGKAVAAARSERRLHALFMAHLDRIRAIEGAPATIAAAGALVALLDRRQCPGRKAGAPDFTREIHGTLQDSHACDLQERQKTSPTNQ